MIDYDKLVSKREILWPENYYSETDARKREALLEERIKEEPSRENELRRLLWEKRYTDGRKGFTGIDYYMKTWIDLESAAEKRNSLFGRKNFVKAVKDMKNVFQFELLQNTPEYESVWYAEFINFCCFYIELCKSDKSYSGILFNLGKMSDENLALKLAKDLYHKTVVLPKEIGMKKEFSLFAKAARESFGFYYPKHLGHYDRQI